MQTMYKHDGPHYTNAKGNIVKVEVSDHAVRRYVQRTKSLLGESIRWDTALERIRVQFNSAVRKQRMNWHHVRRMKRHGGATLYFHSGPFAFVVENRKIVTIEICQKNKRHLN